MPECYTHAHIATKALMRSGMTVASQPAFLAGANGPDPLYMYGRWAKESKPDLPRLAVRMHKEKAGAFLLALSENAITPAQQSYTLGFLTHYITDCTLHPYIAAMSAKGQPYDTKYGRWRMEASIDSTLYYQDYKTYLVPLHAGTPVLITEELAQVSTLLHEAVLQAFGEDIPALAFADTFHDNLKVRRFLISRMGIKKALVAATGSLFRDRRGKTSVLHRMQPAKPLKQLPAVWENPYTNEKLDITLEELTTIAETTSAVCISSAMQYWLGEISQGELADILGNNNYYTGLPIEVQDAGKAALEATEKEAENKETTA